jgi:putative methyltransferase (TIGR04325 family)
MISLRHIKKFGPVQALRRERYRRRFESPEGYTMHSGVFRSFDEAAASVPHATGCNHATISAEFEDKIDRVFPYDYPFLFWLQRIFSNSAASSLVDIGGHIGVHYYAYRKFLELPRKLKWLVVELAEIAKAGQERAERLAAPGLSFTTSLEILNSHPTDIILSSGALHYIEKPLLWNAIARMESKPQHILLNKVPLYQGEDFVSLQNVRPGFSPLYVWNRLEFIRKFEHTGYRLVDEWSVPERHFHIFDDPLRSFGSFSGLYLRLDSVDDHQVSPAP